MLFRSLVRGESLSITIARTHPCISVFVYFNSVRPGSVYYNVDKQKEAWRDL